MVALDERLLEILICPACHGDVEYKDRRKLVICQDCGRQYPVVDGIPVMMVEEATEPSRRSRSS